MALCMHKVVWTMPRRHNVGGDEGHGVDERSWDRGKSAVGGSPPWPGASQNIVSTPRTAAVRWPRPRLPPALSTLLAGVCGLHGRRTAPQLGGAGRHRQQAWYKAEKKTHPLDFICCGRLPPSRPFGADRPINQPMTGDCEQMRQYWPPEVMWFQHQCHWF